MPDDDTPAGSWSPKARRTAPGAPPRALTVAECSALMRLAVSRRPRPVTVVLGSSRDGVSRRAAGQLALAWEEQGGEVLDTVHWPEQAASWLRQARRFTAGQPDLWIVTGTPAGWVQMGRRLALSTDWAPARTLATASLATDELIACGGIGTFDQLRGVRRDGSGWEIVRTLFVDRPAMP
ncbi:hypothetical protein [Streptomyces sp. NBC_00344]|uniref:hypothetical protein n=1 Tax=Streptomyces sp. NBC_00344 TaxID=2975720 RepID=UPI002E20BB16